MKELCVKLSGVCALLMSLPVMYRIHEGDIFNPTSYFLWSLLSLICVVVLVRGKKGGYTIMAGYVLSDLSIGIYAYLKSGRASIGWFEWFIVGLTAVCTIVYVWCEMRGSFKPAVIVNATACMIAGIPLFVDTFERPQHMSFLICWLYTGVSSLGFYGERHFNGKLIPGLSIIYWVILIIRMTVAHFTN
jgi:hypothetical protein